MDEHSNNSSVNLNELKKQIANEIRPLIGHLEDPADRFYAIMSLLREEWEDNLAVEALHAAKAIPDEAERVRSLQSLMSEVSYREQDNLNGAVKVE